MPTEYLLPVVRQQFFDNNGNPLVGGKLFTYASGTQVKIPTYTDTTGINGNLNPVILDSRGECDLWGPANTAYTWVLSPANDTDPPSNPIWTRNGIQFVQSSNPTQQSIGALLWPQTPAEMAAGVTPSNYAYQPGWLPRYGALSDPTNSYGGNGTDNSIAIAMALSVAGQPVYVPAGLWGFKNIIVPAGQTFFGAGVNQSTMIALAGAAGAMLTDNGAAAKTVIHDIAFYCNGPSSGNCTNYTTGFQLGVAPSSAYGTEGYLGEILVRDLPSASLGTGFPGFNVTGNVGEFGNIYLLQTGGLQILGTANMVKQVENVAASGFGILGGSTIVATNLGDTNIEALEIEAPGNYITGGQAPGDTPVNNFTGSLTPLYFSGNASVNALWISLSDTSNPVYDHLIGLNNSATTWNIDNLKLYYGPAKLASITGGLFQDSSGATPTSLTYFPTNSTSALGIGNLSLQGAYYSGMFNAGPVHSVKRQQIQSFTLRVANLSGVINHLIGCAGSPTTATNFAGQISGALPTYTPTPTGSDASTNFAAGGKIGSAAPSIFWFNTAAQVIGDSLFVATLSWNGTAAVYGVVPAIQSVNINATTQYRLCFTLTASTGGTVVSWATALPSNGDYIDVTFLGYVR